MKNYDKIVQYQEKLSKDNIYLETEIENDNLLTIEIIEVPRKYQHTGIGTSIMNMLCEYADKNDIVLQLRPAASSTHSRTKLIKFYLKFGFKINKGENENDEYLFMYREPK